MVDINLQLYNDTWSLKSSIGTSTDHIINMDHFPACHMYQRVAWDQCQAQLVVHLQVMYIWSKRHNLLEVVPRFKILPTRKSPSETNSLHQNQYPLFLTNAFYDAC